MSMGDAGPRSPKARVSSPLGQWLVLISLSAVVVLVLELGHLPAAMLVGPMAAGIVIGVRGGTIDVPQAGFAFAQGVVGCIIAMSLTPAIFPSFAQNWPLFAAAVLATLAASSLLGWLISRWKVLPGTVGIWGTAPGAASAMVLMAGAFGADQRLVAFMQYLRVMMVSIGAALVARIWVDTSGVDLPEIDWFPAIEPAPFAFTLVLAVTGGWIGRVFRLPSPFFLGAFIVGTVLHLGFAIDFQVPHWLAAICYALIGWAIGLKFRGETLRVAARALPQLVLSVLVLMAFCGAIAFFLAHEMGIDPLTAYLATSPGGMDTVAIIAAASTNVDMSFIMTMQAMRFLFVLLAGPPLARLVAGWIKP